MNIEHSSFNFFEQFNQNGFLYNILFFENYENFFFNTFLKDLLILDNFNDIIFSHYLVILLIAFLFVFTDKSNNILQDNKFLIQNKPVVHGWKITGNVALNNIFNKLNISFNKNNFSIWYLYTFFFISFLLISFININKIYLNSFGFNENSFNILNEFVINNYFYGVGTSTKEVENFVDFFKNDILTYNNANITTYINNLLSNTSNALQQRIINELYHYFAENDIIAYVEKHSDIWRGYCTFRRMNIAPLKNLERLSYYGILDDLFYDKKTCYQVMANSMERLIHSYDFLRSWDFILNTVIDVNSWENEFKLLTSKSFAEYIKNFDVSCTIVFDNVITPLDSDIMITLKKSLNQLIPVEFILTRTNPEGGTETIRKIFHYNLSYNVVENLFMYMSSYFGQNFLGDLGFYISNFFTINSLSDYFKVVWPAVHDSSWLAACAVCDPQIKTPAFILEHRYDKNIYTSLYVIDKLYRINFFDVIENNNFLGDHWQVISDPINFSYYIFNKMFDINNNVFNPVTAKVLWNGISFQLINVDNYFQSVFVNNFLKDNNFKNIDNNINLNYYFNNIISYNFNDVINFDNISFKYFKLDENYVSFFFTLFLINFLNFKNYRSSFGFVIPNKLQLFNEQVFKFFLGIFSSNLGDKTESQYFFKIVYTLGLLVLFFNLEGMLHYLPTITSSLINTLYMASIIFFSIIVSMVMYNSFRYFLNLLYPSGTSFALAFLLIPIELLSYVSRIVSLSVRLFANMMAGHTLLKVISSFVLNLLNLIINYYYFVIGLIIPLLLLYVLTNLEIGVSLIQTYIFVILSSIYLKDIFYEH